MISKKPIQKNPSELRGLEVDDNRNFDEITLSHSIEIPIGFSNDLTLRHCISELGWNFLDRIVSNHIYDVTSL